MPETEPESLTRSLLVGGAGIAIASITAYSLAWFYEVGYAGTFGIPIGLIHVEQGAIMVTLAGLILVGFVLLGVMNAVYPMVAERTTPATRYLIRHFPILLFYGAFVIIYRDVPESRFLWFRLFLLWFSLSLFMDFVFPLITQRGKGTYREKLAAQEAVERYWEPRTLVGIAANTSGGLILVRLFLLLGILHLFSYSIGNAEALGQKNFLAPDDQPDSVVLRVYGGTFVCAPIDPNTHEIRHALILRDKSVQAPLHLVWKRVGPLKKKALGD